MMPDGELPPRVTEVPTEAVISRETTGSLQRLAPRRPILNKYRPILNRPRSPHRPPTTDPICPSETSSLETCQKFQSDFFPLALRISVLQAKVLIQNKHKSEEDSHVIAKFAQHVFPRGPLQMLRDWESPGSARCFVQEVSLGAPWWFQDPGGPMVGIAGGIVANIPSLGHTKSPAECPSVARIFVQMMVRWDKQTLWVVPPPP